MGSGLAVVPQVEVGVVLDEERVRRTSEREKVLTAPQGHGGAGRILEIRVGVDELGDRSLFAEPAQLTIERGHVDALAIDRDRDDVGPDVAKRLNGADPGRHLADDGISPVDERVEEQTDRLRPAGGDQHVFATRLNPLIARKLRDHGVDQTRIPDVVAILQGRAAALGEDASGYSGDFVGG